jgi:hypothetical protein
MEMPFSNLPGDARLWIYTADRALTETEQADLLARLAPFLTTWTSHQRPVTAEAALLHDRFVLLAANIPGGDISGCGIDKSVHALEAVAAEAGFAWLPALAVVYRGADGSIQHATRAAFRRLVRQGDVTAETIVFDPSITSVEAWRGDTFELPAAKAWHATVFRIPQPVT